MSVFKMCETCSQIAQTVCECSSPPRFFCHHHASDHRKFGGIHPSKDVFLPLSSVQAYSLQQASDQYKTESIREAILRKNKRIEDLLRQAREAEEDCARNIKIILEERSIIEEVCVSGGLPMFSDSPLLSSLHSLRVSSSFSLQEILERLFSFHSFLPPMPSSLPHLPSSVQSLSSSLQSLNSSLRPSSLPQWELFIQSKAHNEPIRSLAVSDCEKLLASASQDNSIKIWNLESLECIHTLLGHEDWVNSVTFSGKKLISGSDDNMIKIWEGGKCLETLSLHSDFVTSVCISSSKRLLASGGGDNKVFVYSLEKKKTLHSLVSHLDSVNSVVFSPSDRQIVSGSLDESIKIWSTDLGELLNTLNGHSKPITCVCFWGDFIVSSSSDKNIKIWDIENERVVKTFHGHSSRVLRVEANENILASIGQDNSIKIWDNRTKECIQTLEGHGEYSPGEIWHNMGLKFLRGGDYIISGGGDKNIKIFKRVS